MESGSVEPAGSRREGGEAGGGRREPGVLVGPGRGISRDPRQRCWVHKTANVLDKMPKSVQREAKSMLHEMWGADTRAHAKSAFERFCATWEAKYPKAVECLAKDEEELFAFLRLPGGALAEYPDDEPHRVDLRHDPAANGEDEELPEREVGAEPRAPAGHERREAMGAATRLASSGGRHHRREVRQWGERKGNRQGGR